MTDQTATPDLTAPPATTGMDRLYSVALMIALMIVVMRGVMTLITGPNVFEQVGNDNIMRLMTTRDWLAGQGWFDMTQHRLLPGEGLDLHWSRYVDLGIGGVISIFAVVLPMPLAEQVAGIVWPMGLAVGLVLFTGQTTLRVLGPAAAGIAVLMVVCYPPLALGYFGPGKLDHHNVQILLMTVAALSLARADRTVLWGTVAGLSSAMSLAIGLEALFMVAAVSLLHVINAAFGGDDARRRLFTYCVAIFGGALAFFVGQTPPAEWLVRHCDELAPPILALTGVGAAAGLAGLALPARVRGPFAFMGAVAVTTAVGFAIAWPLLSPCLQAPYANLPIETQEFIATRIIEAQPMLRLFGMNPLLAGSYFGIPVVILVLATVTWVREADRTKVIGYLILIAWIGFFASLWQMRQVVILATVTPFLAGYVIAPILQWRLTEKSGRSQLALYGVGAVTLFQPLLLIFAQSATAAVQSIGAENTQGGWAATGSQDSACYDVAQLDALNVIPATTVMTGTNLGIRLIKQTHHSGLAAPYHRSNAALTNGFTYEITDPVAFDAQMQALGAPVFVVCKGSIYGETDSIGSRLAAGDQIDGFVRIETGTADVMAFKRTGQE